MARDGVLVSMSGVKRFRDTEGDEQSESPRGEACTGEISGHIERHIDVVTSVFHEVRTDSVHIDVHHVNPAKGRPFHTLITSGMSYLPMAVPGDMKEPRYLELMVSLPENWEIGKETFKDETGYWPIRQLKKLARFPHKFETWLGWGHIIPNGDPARPFAGNTSLCGVILLPSLTVPVDFYSLTVSEDKTIDFLSVVPLYDEEMNLKRRQGTDVLLDKLERYGVDDVIAIDRQNVAIEQVLPKDPGSFHGKMPHNKLTNC